MSRTSHATATENWEDRVDELFADIFQPKSRLTVSEWAAEFRILSEGVSPEPGPWRHERTPYLVDVMDALSDPDVRKVVVVKSARVGYTEGVIGNGIGYFIDQEPSPMVVYQPTEPDAYDWSKKQLAPMLRDTPALQGELPEGGRNSQNTILDKVGDTWSLAIRGGFSPRVYRRINARVVFFDEVSALVQEAGKEGDPVKLGTKRAGNFPNRKIVLGSTPTLKGLCRITKEFEHTDQRHWHVPCPHCEHYQVLRWGGPDTPYGIKWDRDVSCKNCDRELARDHDGPCPDCSSRERDVTDHPETAYYLCEGCAAPITEEHKPDMVQAGRWVAHNPGHPTPGFFVGPAMISLITDDARWDNLVREWLEAKGEPTQLQVFVNTVLGEPYEERGQKMEPKGLAARAEEYRSDAGELVDVPHGVGLLTASIDVQASGWLELLVRGWGAGEESWLILHERVYGNILAADTWSRLEPLLVKPYVHASGAELRIQAVAVDSGDATDQVYDFVLPRQARKVFAIKGKGGPGEPVISRARTVGKEGVELFIAGADTLKDKLFYRLKIARPGPGYMHFTRQRSEKFNGADAEYFAQFGAEKKVFNRRKRVWEYVQIRDRNEAIDLENYALAALHRLGAGVREELGKRAKEISEAGPDHREAWARPRKKRRKAKVISKGIA